MSCRVILSEIESSTQVSKKATTHAAAGLGGGAVAIALTVPAIGLPAMGYAGHKGAEAIDTHGEQERLTSLYKEKECASRAASSHTNKSLDRGLIRVQKALYENGYNPGIVDGIYGPKTKLALEKYQKADDLKVTGKSDSQTKRLLLK